MTQEEANKESFKMLNIIAEYEELRLQYTVDLHKAILVNSFMECIMLSVLLELDI